MKLSILTGALVLGALASCSSPSGTTGGSQKVIVYATQQGNGPIKSTAGVTVDLLDGEGRFLHRLQLDNEGKGSVDVLEGNYILKASTDPRETTLIAHGPVPISVHRGVTTVDTITFMSKE